MEMVLTRRNNILFEYRILSDHPLKLNALIIKGEKRLNHSITLVQVCSTFHVIDTCSILLPPFLFGVFEYLPPTCMKVGLTAHIIKAKRKLEMTECYMWSTGNNHVLVA